jgi:hypothetical protein
MTFFEFWLENVDKAFIALVGVDRDSWPDQDYVNMFEEGYMPEQAVALAVENEYGQAGLDAFHLEAAY